MSKVNHGGAAFPNAPGWHDGVEHFARQDGMTLRDFFAAKFGPVALQNRLNNLGRLTAMLAQNNPLIAATIYDPTTETGKEFKAEVDKAIIESADDAYRIADMMLAARAKGDQPCV